MTALISVETYRRISGDTTSVDEDVELALADSQALIEQELCRPLEVAEYVETLPVIRGYIYPSYTPIIEAEYPILSGVRLSDPGVEWAFVDGPNVLVPVTYTAGWTTQTLPIAIRNAIILTAHRSFQLASIATSSTPFGASSVRVGDVTVSYKDDGGSSSSVSVITRACLDSISRYRRRTP